MSKGRTDVASKVIRASPHTIWNAFVNPHAWSVWLPPKGMRGRIETFDLRESGAYRMELIYDDASHAGKSSAHTDVVEGQFVDLVKNERMIQVVKFKSDDPLFAGTMTMTWSLESMSGVTKVSIVCENVPLGIRKEDHDIGLRSTLENLAAFTETPP